MSQIDEFESAFKSADKPVFRFEEIVIRHVVVVLDSDKGGAAEFLERVDGYLEGFSSGGPEFKVTIIEGRDYSSVQELLDKVTDCTPDLICTYRNLHIPATEFPYSLGVYIDVLTQATDIPILLMPRPIWLNDSTEFPSRPESVLAVTDHLAGDYHLVSMAARFASAGGKLTLVHVEDQLTFDRYIETIGKIPDLNTDLARETIMHQLLKEPADYIQSCRKGVEEAGLPVEIESIVTAGHRLEDYRKLLQERQIDLLVMNTKDDEQMAMHGLAYPLSVEFRKTPMLLL
ncbi:MAG: hypothetical protein ACR2NP_07015 [Pirellulaceae bacterium]